MYSYVVVIIVVVIIVFVSVGVNVRVIVVFVIVFAVVVLECSGMLWNVLELSQPHFYTPYRQSPRLAPGRPVRGIFLSAPRRRDGCLT